MDLQQRRMLRADSAWPPDKPFVIATTAAEGRHHIDGARLPRAEGQQRTLTAVNAAAAAYGLGPGMSLSHARAIVPELKATPARPLADARALDKLTIRMLRYSPLVAAAPPDGLWVDATGAAHLFGGEDAMIKNILRRLRGLGLSARAAMAATPGAAWAWARYGSGNPVLTERHALDPLPLRALRLPEASVHSLRHVGLKTIGDLKRMPRATIPIRFGAEVLTRLDQAMGTAAETINPILPPAARRRQMSFADPIATADDLKRCIDHLTAELCRDLEQASEGARRFDMVFTRVDGHTQTIRIACAHPSRAVTHLSKLLAEKLPAVDPGFGIEAAALTAWRVDALTPAQLNADGSVSSERDLGELVDRLSARVGARNVFKVAAVESDLPERAAVPANPMARAPQDWPPHLPRPMRLLSPPERVQVIALLPDYPPAKFRWRAQMHSVRISDGPERVFGEWWQSRREVGEQRDYFRVENEQGQRYWLFRVLRPGQDVDWFMHGVFA